MAPFAPDWAFFLDIDGTLLDIVARPDAVRINPGELTLVENLARCAGGAAAVVSGRPIRRIDELFAPLRLPAAGQHGAERRDARGGMHRVRFPAEGLQRAAREIESFARSHPGLVFEDKGWSVALHYRLAPQLAGAAQAALREAAAALGAAFEVQAGKMVVELKPAGCDKGLAIEQFMAEPPFAGRTPVFLGDDVTDELGFRVVNRLGGHSVKVGEGDTAARWRLSDPAAARAWLAEYAKWRDR